MATVELQSVTKVFTSDKKNTLAVDNVSFDAQDNSITVLVGASGCGKTTVLRMIAGLEDITQGQIRIDGRVVNELEPKDRDIAMVFQNYALYPHMSVFDNMAFGLKINRVPKDEIKKRVQDAAELLQLTSHLQNKPKELSGGQRQRVAVGRAIVRRPKVLLFDEPLSNLDAKLRVEMRMELMRLQKEMNWTMIYVTHDQMEAMTMTDSMVLLSSGRVQQTGSALSMYERPVNKFVAEFIGTPPMNFFEGTLTTDGAPSFQVDGQRVLIPEDIRVTASKKIVMGVRPEHIEILNTASDGQSLKAELEFIEHLGHENFYYFNAADRRVICRSAQDSKPYSSGAVYYLKPRRDRMHFFDADSGSRIQ